MSVIMTLRVGGDAAELERRAAENPEAMRSIANQAKEHGLIAHRFYASEGGEVLVIDEWPDAESFQRFFESMRAEIEGMMAEVGATGQPEITFWRELETNDAVGWGAEG